MRWNAKPLRTARTSDLWFSLVTKPLITLPSNISYKAATKGFKRHLIFCLSEQSSLTIAFVFTSVNIW